MRLWLISLGAALAFGAFGYVLAQYSGSRIEGMARWLGATPTIEFAKSAVADLQSKDLAALERKSDRSIVNEQFRQAFAKVSGQLPSSPPQSIRLGGWWKTRNLTNDAKTVWHVTMSLEYGIDGKWFLFNARVRTEEGEPPILEWFNYQPLPASLETINRFSLQGKKGIHYLFLVFLITIATCNVAALILCVRHKMPLGRKILWLVGILTGFGTFALNWTSGAVQFLPLSFHIPAVGFWQASPLAPYIFWISAPVFTISFLFQHLPSPRQIETDADRTLPSGS